MRHKINRQKLFWVFLLVCAFLLLTTCFGNNIKLLQGKGAPGWAKYVATPTPDEIILLPAANATTMQTINWRTSADITDGVVRYRDITDNAKAGFHEVEASFVALVTPRLENDRVNHRFSAGLQNLQSGHTYEYYVGSPAANAWSQRYTFTTAVEFGEPFSFIFIGDIQKGIPKFKTRFKQVEKLYPEVRFVMAAGDFLQRGTDRNMWDELFDDNLFTKTMLVPALGNHELSRYKKDDGEAPLMYFNFFRLPVNEAANFKDLRTYGFAYGDAYFIILDSNGNFEEQVVWLEQQLSLAEADGYKWKIIMFHSPVFNIVATHKGEDAQIQKIWQPIFDRYNVDLVLGGHDHGYMRSPGLKNGQTAALGTNGTIYVVAVAGSKYYKLEPMPEDFVVIEGVSTYQKIDILKNDSGVTFLEYTAYNFAHEVVDEFVIVK